MIEAVDWIRTVAIPLASVEAGNGFADLEPLRGVIGDARIVSLGEATHGTREFFQLKHRLLEYCVSELGFTIFGIEASYPECLRVNDYVLHGTGNPAHALAGTRFWTWDTEEVLALIGWMRAWNETHTRQVKFYGFDMQFPTEAALGTLDYLKRVAPDLAAASVVPLWPFSDDFSADHLHLLPAATCNAAQTCVERIIGAFSRERSAWIAATSELEWHLARLHAVVLGQSAAMRLSSASRDVAMAENVAAILAAEGPHSKAVLWAHNGHAAKETTYHMDDGAPIANMGSRLRELFGRDQLVVGFAFNQGSFQAIDAEGELVAHTVPPAPEGSLDNTLAASNIPLFLLDLRAAPSTGLAADWLASQPSTRSIGAAYRPEYAEQFLEHTDPRRAYDVLAFVENTTPARATPTGRRPNRSTRELAPTPQNLALAGDGNVPEEWHLRPIDGYRVTLSDRPSPAGGRTVCITQEELSHRWGRVRLYQEFSAADWRGKRLELRVAVRADVAGPGNGAQVYVEVTKKLAEPWGDPVIVTGVLEKPVRSSQWSRYTVAADVPHEAHSIIVGLVLAGNGAAWFGDIELVSP